MTEQNRTHPARRSAATTAAAPEPRGRSRRTPWLRPASAALILGVDWVFFGAEIVTLQGALLLASLSAFVITATGVFWIQRSRNGDSRTVAALKALFGGVVAGIPTSIGGTLLGTLVLVLAGLSRWGRVRRPVSPVSSPPSRDHAQP